MRKILPGFLIFATALNISAQGNDTTGFQKLARDIIKELIEINATFRYGSTKAAEARATESLLPIWLRVNGAIKSGAFNFKIVR